MTDTTDLGPTAAIVTIGDEIVEGRVLNENATWLSDELMARGVWPRVVVAVPDVSSLIVRMLRIAADAADLLFVCGGLGFTPDDITRKAVATAFFRDVEVDRHLAYRFRRDNAWVDEQIATAAAPFPVDATPLETATGGVPGFRLRNAYVLPGMPAENAGDVSCVDAAGWTGSDPSGDHPRGHDRGSDHRDARAVRG
jgi:molybdenum cofactor synthesis domain-containing protein